MYKLRVLVADDDLVFCKLTADLIRNAGYEVKTVSSVEETQRVLANEAFDLMMQDMCFPALQDGFGMLEEVHEKYPAMPVLMISGSGHIPDAVNAIKYGATDFIEKPIAKEHLLIRLSRLSENLKIKRDMHDVQVSAIGMIGKSPSIQKVYDSIIQAAKFDTPVLISGETGVGKELAAAAIHRLSERSQKNMVTINCASIPRELFEAELFGYEKGAFTGAQLSRTGYFEFAGNSSIFLDEIGELPLDVQAKLLRVISEKEIQKLGGKVHKINTRLISASNQNLDQMIQDGSFRSDLFYRISTIAINIPPLRERKEDIILLTEHFVNSFCNSNQIQPKLITPSAAAWLLEQDFPGNVRELKNRVERAVVFCQNDELSVVDFTTKGSVEENNTQSFRDTVRAFERQYLESVLMMHDGNLSQTALYLQMDKSNLSKKISALGISLARN
ncbi:MAG TPA: sigma-54 dependent transcriptional regulator [Candidatus Cloacimonadota bacterium]|nr:sigma-54 dependent transcriptional regulator [Candidatus Cloacimonadota bacterium]HPF08637.1 sigma-54 dependent transcriptional regulator [Candidatus Cloacimonadota bacterium]